ncbi:MAG: arylsulfatase [Bacteroidota bacterium]
MAPNIILIMTDDMGYSDLGCFGGEIPTPNLDKLAENGLRMTHFYNAARCCPTRASLLTGLYPHQAGMGDMVEGRLAPDSSYLPAYAGYLPNTSVTLAEMLKIAGYHTMISGKWHVGDEPEHWPHNRGFDDVFTLINGATNYFTLAPWMNENQQILVLDGTDTVVPGPDFYLTNAITEHALEFINNRPAEKPFFLYLAHTAPHWPLHALPEDIELFKGKYMEGWEALRQQRFDHMKQLEIVPPQATLPDQYNWRNLTPDWDSLSQQQKELFDARMAVHAAMIYRMDQGIGEIIATLEENGELENTLIMFLSDNGATKATIYLVEGWVVDRSGPVGSARSFDSQGPLWAQASNTPFSLYKSQTAEGGIRTPFIAHWPAEIKAGSRNDQPAHVIDIMNTLVDISGGSYPETINGYEITSTEGISLKGVFSGKSILADRYIFFEHMGNKAVSFGKWKLLYINSSHDNPQQTWKLFNLETDPAELHDLTEQYPEMAREMKVRYQEWAARVDVYEPYDSLLLARPL